MMSVCATSSNATRKWGVLGLSTWSYALLVVYLFVFFLAPFALIVSDFPLPVSSVINWRHFFLGLLFVVLLQFHLVCFDVSEKTVTISTWRALFFHKKSQYPLSRTCLATRDADVPGLVVTLCLPDGRHILLFTARPAPPDSVDAAFVSCPREE